MNLTKSKLATAAAAMLLATVTVESAPARHQVSAESLRLAINDLVATCGTKYPRGAEFLQQLEQAQNDPAQLQALAEEALLANPLLDFDRLLVVRRWAGKLQDYDDCKGRAQDIGMPCNHWCNSSLSRTNYNNQIATLSPVRPGGKMETLYRPPNNGYVGEVDLHFKGDRMLFSQSDATNWKVFEMKTDGTALRQVSRMPDDVDAFDACYLPDGKIIFGSTASYQAIPCWSGMPHRVANLYEMDADGSHVRQLCFDQDHDLYPTVRNDGQVMFTRWDYTGIRHEYLRILMTMNPDGTGQRALYGSNSWWPNALYFTRPIPGDRDKVVGIVSDYHGVPRMGWLVLLDTAKGWNEADGVIQQIPGRGKKVEPIIKEKLVTGTWPMFLHPYPLSAKYFLVACRPSKDCGWGIYLVDVFDNMVCIKEEPGWALLEPIPVRKTPAPPVIPDRVDLAQKDATIYLHDVYAGKGMEGVPRGTVKNLRLFSYHFGYPGLAGSTRIGIGGPWEVNRILGTVAVEKDGSAMFRVPANTPISVQPLDAEGKAVQVMRSWYTAMPGEKTSCMGCHERNGDAPPSRLGLAAARAPREIAPWHGPARGFDFEREVQPVLDRYCVSCHDSKTLPDLRARKFHPDYQGWPIGQIEPMTLEPSMDIKRVESVIDRSGPHKNLPYGRLYFTPAYEALFPLVRRVNIEDDVDMPLPGEFHADTSRLVQLLKKGHYDVALDTESWDRLITWIDLNAPCHGTWGEVYQIPGNAHQRRMELRALYGGPTEDPEEIPKAEDRRPKEIRKPKSEIARVEKPLRNSELGLPSALGPRPSDLAVPLGDGVTLALVRIPSANFMMGKFEVTNRQYRQFDSSHDSGYARDFRLNLAQTTARLSRPLNEPDQPVVRVSWQRAMDFCRWLSQKTGMSFMLPTEAQWEYACRAGSTTAFSFGDLNADFSMFANVADRQLWRLGDYRFNDGAVVNAPVGKYRPNAWGLHDMHGNAAEWTSSDDAGGKKVVRGGSFYDKPEWCSSSFRTSYPAWQRLHNVGFRVISAINEPPKKIAQANERKKS